MRILDGILKSLVVVALILAVAECLARLKVHYLHGKFAAGGSSFSQSDFSFIWLPVTSTVNHRLWNTFLLHGPDPRLRSPVQEILPELRNVSASGNVDRYRLKPGAYVLTDFTRSEPEKAKFKVHINSAGFRGRERPLSKKKGVTRILCWGAYQTFGHAVDDEFTYPAQLEQLLNKRKMRFEVWNAGVQSMSLRDARARLAPDVDDVRPDIVILEFGFVDVVAMTNDTFINPGHAVFPVGSAAWRYSGDFFAWLYTGPLGKSYLMAMLSQNVAGGGRETNLEFWKKEMAAVINWLQKKNVRIIIMNPSTGGFPEKEYEALAENGRKAFFFNTKEALAEYLGQSKGLPLQHESGAWAEEFDEAMKKVIRSDPAFHLKKNFSHPNETAYRIIAEKLAETILRSKRP